MPVTGKMGRPATPELISSTRQTGKVKKTTWTNRDFHFGGGSPTPGRFTSFMQSPPGERRYNQMPMKPDAFRKSWCQVACSPVQRSPSGAESPEVLRLSGTYVVLPDLLLDHIPGNNRPVRSLNALNCLLNLV
jgi:hypothetical protein